MRRVTGITLEVYVWLLNNDIFVLIRYGPRPTFKTFGKSVYRKVSVISTRVHEACMQRKRVPIRSRVEGIVVNGGGHTEWDSSRPSGTRRGTAAQSDENCSRCNSTCKIYSPAECEEWLVMFSRSENRRLRRRLKRFMVEDIPNVFKRRRELQSRLRGVKDVRFWPARLGKKSNNRKNH